MLQKEKPQPAPQNPSGNPFIGMIVGLILVVLVVPVIKIGLDWLTNPSARAHRKIDRVWKNLPAFGNYQSFPKGIANDMDPNYVDPVHGFFIVSIPSGWKPIPKLDNTTARIESGPKEGTIVPASRITFDLDKSASVSVLVRETFQNELEKEEMISMLQKARDKFNESVGRSTMPYRYRWSDINGVKAFEGMIFVDNGKGFGHFVKFKKDGLDHTITFVCDKRGYANNQKEFITFLKTYKSVHPR